MREVPSVLGAGIGFEAPVRDTQTRPQRLTDTARSTAAMLRMTLMGSDMVASKHGFAVTCNRKRLASSCEPVCHG